MKKKQNKDGGWGEDCSTYWEKNKNYQLKKSVPSQTAWAIMSLLITEKYNNNSVKNGINFLINNFNKNKLWEDNYFNAVGFPKVFYITYHGYAKYFPVWAISKYYNLKKGKRSNRINGL